MRAFALALLIFLSAGPLDAREIVERYIRMPESAIPDVALVYPESPTASSKPPYPLIVLSHGFGRSHVYHMLNARHLASEGFFVAVPDDTRPESLVRLVQELIDRSLSRRGSLRGLVDHTRIGLAGHSAGGAGSLVAALELQETSTPVKAICLLDAVPGPDLIADAPSLEPVALSSFRAEPGTCNAHGVVVRLLQRVAWEVDDILVTGSTHCDQEDPSDVFCSTFCGKASGEHQRTFRRLMISFFKDALLGDSAGQHEALVSELEWSGRIVQKESGGGLGE